MSEANVVPNVVHVIKTDASPISRFLFLNLLSVLHNLNPSTLFLHATTPPHGFFWNLTQTYDVRRQIVVAPIKAETYRLEGKSEAPRFRPDWAAAHQSDIIRMNILRSTGGIYVDTDVLVLRSFDPLRGFGLTMGLQEIPYPGLQTRNKLCNGVILARRGSAFLEEWYRALYNASFESCWDCHSIELPSALWAARYSSSSSSSSVKSGSREVNILPLEALYDPSYSRADLTELFRDPPPSSSSSSSSSPAPSSPAPRSRVSPPYDQPSVKYGQHLWNRVPTAASALAKHRLDDVCLGGSIYNQMLRFALKGSVFLRRLCPDL